MNVAVILFILFMESCFVSKYGTFNCVVCLLFFLYLLYMLHPCFVTLCFIFNFNQIVYNNKTNANTSLWPLLATASLTQLNDQREARGSRPALKHRGLLGLPSVDISSSILDSGWYDRGNPYRLDGAKRKCSY